MKTLYTILQKCIGAEYFFYPQSDTTTHFEYYQNIYNYERANILRNPFLTLTCYDAMHYINITYKHNTTNQLKRRTKVKFEVLKGVLENMFFTVNQKEEFFKLFSKAQRIYHALARLSYICKLKRTTIKIKNDLYLNPIEIGDRNVICIYQQEAKYLFTAQDLINISVKSLTNHSNYFSNPLAIKNPYTNVPFNKAILYNIYFFIKRSWLAMPPLMHQYFMHDFNLKTFVLNNECILREMYITNFVFNTPPSCLYGKVMIMIHSNYHTRKLNICKEFGAERLVPIMLPYLYLSEVSQYSLNPDKRYRSGIILKKKMERFYKFNPLFGRRFVAARSNVEPAINDKHISFYNSSVENDIVMDYATYEEDEYSNDDDDDNDDDNDDDDDGVYPE